MMIVAAASAAVDSCRVGPVDDRVTYAHCFSLTGDAGQLAHFAGVLTGLTFTALALLARSGGEDQQERPAGRKTLLLLLSSFFSFAVTTYLLTIVVAEIRSDGRAASLSFCASLVLVLALMQLFVGVAYLVDHLAFSAAEFAADLARFVGALAIVFIGMTAVDGAGMTKSESAAWHTPVAYLCAVLIVSGIGYLILLSVVWKHVRPRFLDERPALVAGIAAASTMLYTLTSAYWSERRYTDNMPAWIYGLFMVLSTASILAYCAMAPAGNFQLWVTRRVAALRARARRPEAPEPTGERAV
jgi:hypothetical protein